MVFRPRTRQLRRAVAVAALGALVVPATAGAATKKTPVITKVTPKTAYVGAKLTITGKHFKRGKAKNSVLFRRDGGKALFVKADVSTTKKLTVVLPKSLEKYMLTQGGQPTVTRFRVRVLAGKLGKAFTSVKESPLIAPERIADAGGGAGGVSDGAGIPPAPDGDCDGDRTLNSADADDDNDLLPDPLELSLKLDPCVGDTDGDGVEDGFEYQSAIDLNNDDYQAPNTAIPFPAKTPYPNPLFKDADVDYDGDSLTLDDEYKLWKYTYEVNFTASRTLTPLSYTDGAQYSLSQLTGGNGRRQPTQLVATYAPPQTFRTWLATYGFESVTLRSVPGIFSDPMTEGVLETHNITNMDRVGGTTPDYWNVESDLYVSDNERDEDADGLTNYHEVSGPMTRDWWEACYSNENAYPIKYAGTKAYDNDSDGDGIVDGADDQDFDDVPNIMELSRSLAGNYPIQAANCDTGSAIHDSSVPNKALVNPFNPCLPDRFSRTCPIHPTIGQKYPPFDTEWEPLVLN
ncbi:IPT/TIG domain-containing protein [Solirubrobacter sp. CPCC 204708]|uniref:IPT/TIG domain-containing protein n=1 Tax=Solirubrobacter deserti TaxID=2282478 RepID=A0ABT4RPQ0_9ACTN|nr:IPT/TIG domain-containing protein [Solirubrobacter deserti]MBE2316621.1 IPT/TIG domain-containing protein [Solirubrobacter deserti]MDA0140519.1 IPT/TIG domain-containing protein [Solirubrobacter deserti]